MALKDNLVAYYKLDEASGTRVDSHNSNDLSVTGTVGSVSGISGNAADFSASGYLSAGDAADFDFSGDMSVSFFYTPDISTGFNLFDKWVGTGSNRSWQFVFNENNLFSNIWTFYTSDNGATSGQDVIRFASYSFSTGTTYHIVFTFDASASEYKMYVNGSLHDTKTGSNTSIYNSTAALLIGDGFDGQVDEVALWNKVVDSTEVSTINNSGSGHFYDDWDAVGGSRRIFSIS